MFWCSKFICFIVKRRHDEHSWSQEKIWKCFFDYIVCTSVTNNNSHLYIVSRSRVVSLLVNSIEGTSEFWLFELWNLRIYVHIQTWILEHDDQKHYWNFRIYFELIHRGDMMKRKKGIRRIWFIHSCQVPKHRLLNNMYNMTSTQILTFY